MWASKGDFVLLYPLCREAAAFDKKYVFLESFIAEDLTVRPPLDKRRRRRFGPQEATWAHVEDEAEKVRYESAIGLRRDPFTSGAPR